METQKYLFELKPSQFIKIAKYIIYILLIATIIKIAISPYIFFNSWASYIWFINLFCFYAFYSQIKYIGFSVQENGFIRGTDSNSRLSAIPISEISSVTFYKNYYFEAIEKKISGYVLLDKENRVINYLSSFFYSKEDAYKLVLFLKQQNSKLIVDIDNVTQHTISNPQKIILNITGQHKLYRIIGIIEIFFVIFVLFLFIKFDIQKIIENSDNLIHYYFVEHKTKMQFYILMSFVFIISHWIYSTFKGGAFGKVYEDGLISLRTSGFETSFFYISQIKKVTKSIARAASTQVNTPIRIAYYSFTDKNNNVIASFGLMLMSSNDITKLFDLIKSKVKNVEFENC